MNRFIRYWNQNRMKIIIAIIVIVFIWLIIQVLNGILSNSTGSEVPENIIDKSKPIESIITGEKVSEEKTDENINIIKEFIQFGNNKEYEKAYSLLTDDCKNEFSNDVNVFIQNYCNNIFSSKKTYDIQLWTYTSNLYTYQVMYYEDNMLATGNVNLNKNIQDYITVTKVNDENKININGFITKQSIEKSKEINGIEIIVNDKKVYKNYEKYSVIIRNRTMNTIMICDDGNSTDICLFDGEDIEYQSFLEEIPSDSLSLKMGYEKRINIKFNKLYGLNRTIRGMRFKNILLNVDDKNSTNQSNIGIEITF